MTDTPKDIQDLFARALTLEKTEQAAFLGRACDGNRKLHLELQSLLDVDSGRMAFLDAPVSPLAEISELPPGTNIGAYQIDQLLGRGGMGDVYRAYRRAGDFPQCVAIKVLRAEIQSIFPLQRFRREKRILANIGKHPNIANILDGGTTKDGHHYLIMEYIDGIPLDRYCKESRLPIRRRLRLFEELCSGVEFAHSNLILHRDLKPQNVLVTADGRPMILDFGISTFLDESRDDGITIANNSPYTPGYASPEQIRQQNLTIASDIYSLGMILFEISTGERPYSFQGHGPEAIRKIICEFEPLAPNIDTDLDSIILKCLRKLPEERYPTVSALSDDIGRYLQGFPVSERRKSTAHQFARFIQRNRIRFFLSCAISALVLVLVLISQSHIDRAKTQEERAQKVEALATQMIRDLLPRLEHKPSYALERAAREIREDQTAKLEAKVHSTLFLANTAIDLEEIGLGIDTLYEAFSYQQEIDNGESMDAARILNWLGLLLQKEGRLREAEEAYGRSLEVRRRQLPDRHIELAETLFFLSWLQLGKEPSEKAHAMLDEAWDILRQEWRVVENLKDEEQRSHRRRRLQEISHTASSLASGAFFEYFLDRETKVPFTIAREMVATSFLTGHLETLIVLLDPELWNGDRVIVSTLWHQEVLAILVSQLGYDLPEDPRLRFELLGRINYRIGDLEVSDRPYRLLRHDHLEYYLEGRESSAFYQYRAANLDLALLVRGDPPS